jgi:hypothetical protein
MNKFIKRTVKILPDTKECLIIGTGMGHFQDILDLFQTVFVVDIGNPRIRHKKLIYRESFYTLSDLNHIKAVFVDRAEINRLSSLTHLWTKCYPLILIEGNDVIDRTQSGILYDRAYRCVDQRGYYHVWKRI